jgi:hypothetical protein
MHSSCYLVSANIRSSLNRTCRKHGLGLFIKANAQIMVIPFPQGSYRNWKKSQQPGGRREEQVAGYIHQNSKLKYR